MILKKTLFILLEIIFFIIPTYSQDNLKITDKPLEVTILAIHNDLVFNENWSVFKEAFKDTNIKLKGIGSKNLADEIQAFNLMITFGELPEGDDKSSPVKCITRLFHQCLCRHNII